jgi:Ca2+/Na+ antiporter
MFLHALIFVVAMIAVVHGATTATRHAALLAESYRLSKYLVGFIVVAVISILPETFIALSAAFAGTPEFGLGTLFGSNIADLTLVFAILVFAANRRLRVETKILRHNVVYPFVLLLPIILGLDGFFSRADGLALIVVGVIFYVIALKNGIDNSLPVQPGVKRREHAVRLLGSMTILLVGAHLVVTASTAIAIDIGINPKTPKPQNPKTPKPQLLKINHLHKVSPFLFLQVLAHFHAIYDALFVLIYSQS